MFKGALAANFIVNIAASPIASLNKDLRPLLSQNAAIWYPGSEGFSNATNRWSADTSPGIDVVVSVAAEKDVQATVSSIFHFSHSCPAPVNPKPNLRSKI